MMNPEDATRFNGPGQPVEMKTQMLRNTNAYVSTQISTLRQLAVAYADPASSPGQRAAMRVQMQNLSDQIQRDMIPVDIDADEVLRREVNWDVWAFWSIVIGVWGVVLGYVIAWLWEKIVG